MTLIDHRWWQFNYILRPRLEIVVIRVIVLIIRGLLRQLREALTSRVLFAWSLVELDDFVLLRLLKSVCCVDVNVATIFTHVCH